MVELVDTLVLGTSAVRRNSSSLFASTNWVSAETRFMNTTLAYYDHNAQRYFDRTHARLDLDALREFTSRLPAGGKVLDAGCGTGRDLQFFHRHGFAAEGVDGSEKMVTFARETSGCKVWQADLMLLSVPKEHYDGIWAHRSFLHLPPNGCLRVMGSFFATIKSGGHLFMSIEEGSGETEDRTDDPQGPSRKIYRYGEDDFASLLRQSGFQVLSQGRGLKEKSRLAFMTRRL